MPRYEDRPIDVEGIDTPDLQMQFERPGMEIQQFLIERAKKHGMTSLAWVERHGENFRQLFDEKDPESGKTLHDKFVQQYYDEDPEPFLRELQEKLDGMPR